MKDVSSTKIRWLKPLHCCCMKYPFVHINTVYMYLGCMSLGKMKFDVIAI